MNPVTNENKCAVESVPFYNRKQRLVHQDAPDVLCSENLHGITLNFLRAPTRERSKFDTSRRYHQIGGGGTKYRSNRVWTENKFKLVRYAKGNFSYSKSGSCNPQVAGVSGPRLKSNPLPPFVSKQVKHYDDERKSAPEPQGFWAGEYDTDEDEIEPVIKMQPEWSYTAFLADDESVALAREFGKKQSKRLKALRAKELLELITQEASSVEIDECPEVQGFLSGLVPAFVSDPLAKVSQAATSVSDLVDTVQNDRANLLAKASSAAEFVTTLGYATYKLYDLKVVLGDLEDTSKPMLYRWARLVESIHQLFKKLCPDFVVPVLDGLGSSLRDVPKFFHNFVEKQGMMQDELDLFSTVAAMFGRSANWIGKNSNMFRNFNICFSFVKNAKTVSERIWSLLCTAGLYVAAEYDCEFMTNWILSTETGRFVEFERLYKYISCCDESKIGYDPQVDYALVLAKKLSDELAWSEPTWEMPKMREFSGRVKRLEELWSLHRRRTELVYGRINPFCFCIWGESDVGKTGMMDVVAHRMLSAFPIEERVFWKNDDKFFEGIPKNVQCIGLDDWAAKSDFEPDMLLVLKTGTSASLPMAFELKGKIEFRGSLLMLNTNTPYPPMNHLMNNPGAVLRRRDMLVEMSWKKDAEIGDDGKRLKRLDWSHAEFYIQHPEDPTIPRVGPFNFLEIQAQLFAGYDAHVSRELAFLESKKLLFPPSCSGRGVDFTDVDLTRDFTLEQSDFTRTALQHLFREVFSKWHNRKSLKDPMAVAAALMQRLEVLKGIDAADHNALLVLNKMALQVFYYTNSKQPDIADEVNSLRSRLFTRATGEEFPPLGTDEAELQGEVTFDLKSAAIGAMASWFTMGVLDVTKVMFEGLIGLTAWLFGVERENRVDVDRLVREFDLPAGVAAELAIVLQHRGTKTQLFKAMELNENDPESFCKLVIAKENFGFYDSVPLDAKISSSVFYESPQKDWNIPNDKIVSVQMALLRYEPDVEREGAYSDDKVRVKRRVQRVVRQEGAYSQETRKIVRRPTVRSQIAKEGVSLPQEQKEKLWKSFPRVAKEVLQETPQTEGFTDPSAAITSMNLVKQLGRVKFTCGSYENKMNFVPVVGSIILMPRHLLVPTGSSDIASNGVLYLEQYTSAGTKFSKPIPFFPERASYVRKHEVLEYGRDTSDPCPAQLKGKRCECHVYDWVLYDCGKSSVVTYGDHRKLFIKDADLNKMSGLQSGTLVVKRDGGVTEIEPQDIRPIDRPVVTRTHEGSGTEKIVEGWQYSAGTQPGDCGAPLLVHNTLVQPGKIIGIHTAAYRNSSNAFATIVTQELVKIALDDLPLPIVISEVPEVEGCALREFVTGDVLPLGRVSAQNAVSVPNKSEYYPSPIQHEFDVLKAPSILSNSDPRYVERNGDVYANAMQKFGGERVQPSEADMLSLQKATDLLTQFFDTFPRREKPRVWTLDESLNGLGCVNRINIHSSAGWPWSLPRNKGHEKGKHAYVCVGDRLTLQPVMEAAVREREQAAMQGVRVPSVWTANLKSELRPVERVKSGKTRGFVGCPIDYTIVFRKYFGAWIDFMHSHYIENMCGVGMNCESADWTLLANKIRGNATQFFAFDYTDWDGSLLSEVLWESKQLIQNFYGEVWCNVHEVLFDEIINTTMIMFGELIMKRNSIPSGVPCTAEINCLINLLLVVGYYIKSRPKQPTLKDMMSELYVCVYGDDNVGGVSDYAATFMDPAGYEKFIQGFGMTVTNASKSGRVSWEEFENLTFLKRHFRRDGMTFVPLIDMKTVSGMVTWLTDRSDGALETNLNTALRYMFFFGSEIFQSFRQDLQEACRKNGLRICLNTYQELHSEYHGENQFASLVPWLSRKD